MTNEKAIYQLNVMACGKTIFEEFDIKALSIAINSIQENTKLKAEIEQLKELIPKICETCLYEDELGYEEPCNNCKNSSSWILKGQV